jgi:hypothetical protein
VTGSALPIEAKVGIGALVWVAFVIYVVTQGRIATARGHTGQLGQLDRGWDEITPVETTTDAEVASAKT